MSLFNGSRDSKIHEKKSSPGFVPIKAVRASQDSTLYNVYKADNCIQNDGVCHTVAASNSWLKIEFGQVFCIDKVKIVGYKLDGKQFEMDKGKILVLNSKTNDETLCGTLHIRDTPTREGQTYHIQCGKYMCGDQVKLSVIRADNQYDGMIAMKEMTAYYSTGR